MSGGLARSSRLLESREKRVGESQRGRGASGRDRSLAGGLAGPAGEWKRRGTVDSNSDTGKLCKSAARGPEGPPTPRHREQARGAGPAHHFQAPRASRARGARQSTFHRAPPDPRPRPHLFPLTLLGRAPPPQAPSSPTSDSLGFSPASLPLGSRKKGPFPQ